MALTIEELSRDLRIEKERAEIAERILTTQITSISNCLGTLSNFNANNNLSNILGDLYSVNLINKIGTYNISNYIKSIGDVSKYNDISNSRVIVPTLSECIGDLTFLNSQAPKTTISDCLKNYGTNTINTLGRENLFDILGYNHFNRYDYGPSPPVEPFCRDGYYPLFLTEESAIQWKRNNIDNIINDAKTRSSANDLGEFNNMLLLDGYFKIGQIGPVINSITNINVVWKITIPDDSSYNNGLYFIIKTELPNSKFTFTNSYGYDETLTFPAFSNIKNRSIVGDIMDINSRLDEVITMMGITYKKINVNISDQLIALGDITEEHNGSSTLFNFLKNDVNVNYADTLFSSGNTVATGIDNYLTKVKAVTDYVSKYDPYNSKNVVSNYDGIKFKIGGTTLVTDNTKYLTTASSIVDYINLFDTNSCLNTVNKYETGSFLGSLPAGEGIVTTDLNKRLTTVKSVTDYTKNNYVGKYNINDQYWDNAENINFVWFKICTINIDASNKIGKHIGMELIGSNVYRSINNECNNWKLMMNFNTGTDDNLSDTKRSTNNKNIHAVLSCHKLTYGKDTIGPSKIILVETDTTNRNYEIYALLPVYGGIISFSTTSPEFTTFIGIGLGLDKPATIKSPLLVYATSWPYLDVPIDTISTLSNAAIKYDKGSSKFKPKLSTQSDIDITDETKLTTVKAVTDYVTSCVPVPIYCTAHVKADGNIVCQKGAKVLRVDVITDTITINVNQIHYANHYTVVMESTINNANSPYKYIVNVSSYTSSFDSDIIVSFCSVKNMNSNKFDVVCTKAFATTFTADNDFTTTHDHDFMFTIILGS